MERHGQSMADLGSNSRAAVASCVALGGLLISLSCFLPLLDNRGGASSSECVVR